MRTQSKYLDEKLTAADPTSKWISDFVHSDNPKFAGKSKKERIRMALGASYAAKGKSRNEEIDSVPASKSLQKAHDDERKKRGLPDPSYYLELIKKKKQEIEDMNKEEVTLPFTPDKPKKNPGVVPGKYGVGPSLAKHLAKKGMQKQLEKNPIKEEVEELDELSKTTLASYAKKAAKKSKINQMMADRFEKDSERSRNPYKKIAVKDLAKDYQNKAWKREDGYNKAIDRLAKEEVELDGEENAHTKLMNHHANLAKEAAKKAHEFANKYNRKKYEHFHDLADKHVDASYAHEKAAKTNNPQHSKDAYAATKKVNKMAMNEEVEESIASSIGAALGRYAGEKVGLGPAAQAHGEVAGRMIDYHARKLFKKAKKAITGEEVKKLGESGGPVVWKKGNDHIEKYGDEKFALYKNGKKTKYYKSMDDAKSALQEDGKLKGGAKDPCWKGYQMVGTKKKNGREVPNCVPREETELKSFKALREKLNGNSNCS